LKKKFCAAGKFVAAFELRTTDFHKKLPKIRNAFRLPKFNLAAKKSFFKVAGVGQVVIGAFRSFPVLFPYRCTIKGIAKA